MTKRTLSRSRRTVMSAPARTYGYVRVSTLTQAQQGVLLAEQERQIRARCQAGDAEGPWELSELFVENVSGSKPLAERPVGSELLSLVKRGDRIIVSKFDRLFRDTIDALSTIRNLRSREVHLLPLDFPGDVSGNGVAALLVGVLASVAEFERERIAERIAEGKAQARLQGKYQGGARQFGFEEKPDDEGKLVPIPWEQDAIAKMKAMREADHTLREIADAMRVEGHAISYEGVRRVLAREAALAPVEDAA